MQIIKQYNGLLDLYNKEKKRKDKIKTRQNEYKQSLSTCNREKDIDRIKALNERILFCDELLEE